MYQTVFVKENIVTVYKKIVLKNTMSLYEKECYDRSMVDDLSDKRFNSYYHFFSTKNIHLI